MFEVILSPPARNFYQAADSPLVKKLNRCLRQLENDPIHHSNIRRLKHALSARFRYRIGDWRVIYLVELDARRVIVSMIAHRRDVYE